MGRSILPRDYVRYKGPPTRAGPKCHPHLARTAEQPTTTSYSTNSQLVVRVPPVPSVLKPICTPEISRAEIATGRGGSTRAQNPSPAAPPDSPPPSSSLARRSSPRRPRLSLPAPRSARPPAAPAAVRHRRVAASHVFSGTAPLNPSSSTPPVD
jgi:hypothetical protein